ncbi:hypothetical protein ZWY2020_051279 [Hordeum vulgare]|nr:hypothetical protein ZWY2020_051279 [Hordeum vulgare]
MASSRRALPVATLALRVLALLLLAASIIIIATAKIRESISTRKPSSHSRIYTPTSKQISMKLTKSPVWPAAGDGLSTFCSTVRYVLAVGVVGCAYNLVAAVFVVFAVLIATEERWDWVSRWRPATVRRYLDSSSRAFLIRLISLRRAVAGILCVVFIVMISSYSLTK